MIDREQDRVHHWKTDVLGILVIMASTAHVGASTWSTPWEHIIVGLEALAIVILGIGIMRRWGFR